MSRDQAVEQDIIGRERVGLAVRQHLIGLLVIRRGHDVEAERKLLVDGVHRLLVSSAFRHHHRLAFQVRGRRDRRRLRHHQLGAGNEHQGRKRHQLGAFGIRRGRSAFEIDLVFRHRRDAVVRGHLDIFDLEIGIVDLDADLLDDRLAQFEAVPDRPVGVVQERERQ